MGKTGLVLEGGAMRGMYSCGVLDALLDYDIMFPYVIGVSAGAAFGASYISKQRDRNIVIYRKYIQDKRYISYRNLLTTGSLFGLEFVFETIPNVLEKFDYDAFFENPSEFITVTTDITTGRPHYFEKETIDKKCDVLKATCALPLASPNIIIGGVPYLDGGLSDPIPYEKAFEDGCDKIIAVLTQPPGYRKSPQKYLSVIKLKYAKYPKVYERLKERHIVYNKQLDGLKRLEEEGKALIIRPKRPVGFRRIETDISKLEALYHIGEKDTYEIIDKIRSFL